MKKTYMNPLMEEVVLTMNATILNASGGGIHDDNSTDKDDTPSDDPSSDFGW